MICNGRIISYSETEKRGRAIFTIDFDGVIYHLPKSKISRLKIELSFAADVLAENYKPEHGDLVTTNLYFHIECNGECRKLAYMEPINKRST